MFAHLFLFLLKIPQREARSGWAGDGDGEALQLSLGAKYVKVDRLDEAEDSTMSLQWVLLLP